MKVKIAIICFDNPFLKPMEGGKKAMKSKLLSFLDYQDQYDIDVYMMNKLNEGMADEYKGFENTNFTFYQYKMESGIKTIISKFPICTNKRYSLSCAEEMRKHEYDVAIYEGIQVFKYRYYNDLKAKKNILYFHDIESVYRRQISDSADSFKIKVANRMESDRFKKIENNLVKYFNEFWFISKEECEIMKNKLQCNQKCIYLPIPASSIQSHEFGTNTHNMIYVGDLSVRHNFLSVKWFVDEVFKLVQQSIPDVEFRIIGRISDKDKEEISVPGVHVLGYVDDLNVEYENACLVANPMLYGAGVKIKTIDALSYGQIVVTNSKGIEGTELQNNVQIIVNDDANQMAKICIDILNDREKYKYLSENAFNFITNNHSVQIQGMIMNQEIQNLIV